jgi:hypothetical protein
MSGHTKRDFDAAVEAGLTSPDGYGSRGPSKGAGSDGPRLR